MSINWRFLLVASLLGIFTFVLFAFPIHLPGNVGATDFRPYWSSSYLLAHGRDFGDPKQLDHVERTLTGWDDPYTMHAWFAPTGNLILIPFTYLPFSQAVYYWLLVNIAAISISGILLWPFKNNHPWIPLIVTFVFSMTLASLADGQINTFVVLGLGLFLSLTDAKQEYLAGMSLLLTTIKAHLVIIALPLLLLDLTQKRRWKTLTGFGISLIGCALILTMLYPLWPASFWKLLSLGMGMTRETPTLNGLLVIAGEYIWGKWIWLPALAIAAVAWQKSGKEWNQRTLVDVSIIIGLIVSPVGWSYDQIMLLFPILHIIEWINIGVLNTRETRSVIMILLLANGLSFHQRTIGISDVWFFWVPLITAPIYYFVWERARSITKTKVTEPIIK